MQYGRAMHNKENIFSYMATRIFFLAIEEGGGGGGD